MVNVNIAIPDDLHKQLKLRSVIGDTTLKEFIISELEGYIGKHKHRNTQ